MSGPRPCRRVRVLAPMLVLLASGAGAEDQAQSVGLKIKPLPAPQMSLSKSDLSEDGGIYEGLVKSKTELRFIGQNRSSPAELKIGATTLSIGLRGGAVTIQQDGQKAQEVKTKPPLVQMARIHVDDRPYILGFPLVIERPTSGFLFARSGQTASGTIGGVEFSFYDDNLDGAYKSSDDGFAMGKSQVFAPLGRLLSAGGKLYEVVALCPQGSKLDYREFKPEKTVQLTVDPGRGLPVHAAVGNKKDGLYFTIDGKKSTFTVVPGTYELLYGICLSPKGTVAGIIHPGKLPSATIAENGELVLGPPYTLTFKPTVANGKLTINPSSIQLVGVKGEEYAGAALIGSPMVGVWDGKKSVNLGGFAFG